MNIWCLLFNFVVLCVSIAAYIRLKRLEQSILYISKQFGSQHTVSERLASHMEHIKSLEHSHKTLVEIVRNAQYVGQKILDEKFVKVEPKKKKAPTKRA
jgi:hypothetical protein